MMKNPAALARLDAAQKTTADWQWFPSEANPAPTAGQSRQARAAINIDDDRVIAHRGPGLWDPKFNSWGRK